ncbi:hypothetical protein [Virgibacillus salexigens]|uniref:Uncharacterized protein n=1 Tax=Virgibacillus massiliensis TaxID=1462526 RepID=A0A024QH55_9BACI|nr:hypothetical protein [Virgibacillus massiliensis]CDQ41839.1 hypothetical protein BN990_04217 [Virgibacillus massiliensis]
MDFTEPEAVYMCNYAGGKNGVFTEILHFAVEPTQNTRIQFYPPDEMYPNHGPRFVDNFMNYPGTGEPFTIMDAELIHEEVITDEENKRVVNVGFLLPDVNQKAVGQYIYHYFDDPAAGGWVTDESMTLHPLPAL